MNRIKFSYILIAFSFLFVSATALAKGSYGDGAFTHKTTTLKSMMDSWSEKSKKMPDTVRGTVRGTVTKVCEKKGCWLEVSDGTAKVRTTMKDYGFFVPAEIKGKVVLIEGELVQKDLPKSAVKHYMKDEGLSKKEIKKRMAEIKGKSQKTFQFVATGIKEV